MSDHDHSAQLRRWVYALLITVAAGAAIGRIFAVERVNEPSLHKADKSDPRPLAVWPRDLPPASPLFGSNDRSRWATIRSLVDHGTYAIGEREYNADGTVKRTAAGKPFDHSTWNDSGWESDWDTVDKVLDPQTRKFYSSKPPLLTTLLAAVYRLLQMLTGWTLTANLWDVVRTMLILVNVVPFLVYLGLLARLGERFCGNDWARLYMMTAATFATLVTPFLVTLNNHTVGTYLVLFAVYATLDIWCESGPAPWYLFAAAGFFSALAASSELPAAALVAGLGLVLLLRAPRQTLLFFVPSVALVVAGFFLTNWLAIGQLRPAYAEFGTEWYKYEGSHWDPPGGYKRGIDFASKVESRGDYILNVLIGHHGLFSLTPMWLLAFAGMIFGTWRVLRSRARFQPSEENESSEAGDPPHQDVPEQLPWWVFPCSLLLSLIVIGFYLFKTDNYGGWTSGLRWLMWLTPIWLVCMLPVLAWLSRSSWGRGLGYVLLLLSVLSVSYPAWNPWRHPWIYRFMDAQGWIPY